jgi:ribonuclease HI
MSRIGNLSLVAAESMAALMAIELCRDLGLTHVHLEGDAKIIIDAVNCEEADWS